MDQRRNSGFALNAKFKNMHQMIADRRLQRELGTLEQEFTRDANRLRKETLAIKQEFFKLQKEKGSLNAGALHHLESSPGIQDRYTRSKRFGAFDPAMLKAKDEVDETQEEDCRSFAEKRKDALIQNHLSSVPTGEIDNSERIDDPYKRSLNRILDNSKLAKEARITAMKVKAMDAMKPRQTDGNLHKGIVNLARRESNDSIKSFSSNESRRHRIFSMPNKTLLKPTHLLNRASISDSSISIHHGFLQSENENQQLTPRNLARRRKRSNSLAPPTTFLRVESVLNRRRSDTPMSSEKINLAVIERKMRSSSINKLPDIVND